MAVDSATSDALLRSFVMEATTQCGYNTNMNGASSSQVTPFLEFRLPIEESMQDLMTAQYCLKLKYPYPSNLSVSNFVTVLLTQKNYFIWENQVPNMAEITAFSGCLDGS